MAWDSTIRRVTIKRVRRNVIEYAIHRMVGGESTVEVRHANREATFFGPHTGGSALQCRGGAHSLWREDDVEMLQAFQRAFGRVPVEFS